MGSTDSGKWLLLAGIVWLQAFTGTNFDFSTYSSELKSVLGISQVQLNYLAVASDLGKALGWSSGLALLYFPLWVILFVAALMGFIGYGLQWLLIQNFIFLPYFEVFLLCLLAGCSICWFNTVCFVLCVQNFPVNRALALSLTISFNGVSPALYNLASKVISSSVEVGSIYLLLNCILPVAISFIVLGPIFYRQSMKDKDAIDDLIHDPFVFLLLFFIAFITGLYILLLQFISSSITTARILFTGALLLLALPLSIPPIVRSIGLAYTKIVQSKLNLSDLSEFELRKGLITHQNNEDYDEKADVLEVEHSVGMLMRRPDFWFYYMAYFCGATVGLVYSNNIGQISQSLGLSSETTALVTLYSSFSFFGRLLSAFPDFTHRKLHFARTGWLTIALVPMSIAFFLLAYTTHDLALHTGTALIGLSSGFIFATSVTVTSELFGPNSIGVNHNILITNIPIGSLGYGLLAATIYDDHEIASSSKVKMVVCIGKQCYAETFMVWGLITVIGLISSIVLFHRTRDAYEQFQIKRISNGSSLLMLKQVLLQ